MMEKNGLTITAADFRVGYGDFVAITMPQFEAQGRVIGIIGHNGSGKSTLIKAMLELLPPFSGSIQVTHPDGEGAKRLVPEKHMAFSPENGAVFEDITVESYFRLWCRIKQRDANHYKKQGSYYLEKLNVASLMPKLGRQLSKGERRRVQTAIGFMTEPGLFLFDEPFDGLDLRQAGYLADILQDESKKTCFVISSHRMDIIESLSDYLVVLQEGRVLTSGTVEEVCQSLCDRSVVLTNGREGSERFLNLMPLLEQEYVLCRVTRIGKQICITGNDLNSESVRAFLQNNNISGIRVDQVRPSLVEVMNYYLKYTGGGQSQ